MNLSPPDFCNSAGQNRSLSSFQALCQFTSRPVHFMIGGCMFYGLSFYILSLGLVLAFSIRYIFRPTFMPYHRDAVQREWQDIDTRMQKLLMALINALGMAWLSWLFVCVFLLIILLSGPVIFWQLALFQFLYLLGAIAPVFVAIRLRMQTGAGTPVIGGVMVAALSVMGFICVLMS